MGIAALPVPQGLVPVHALVQRDVLGEVEAHQTRPGRGHGLELTEVEFTLRIVGDHPVGHALLADQCGEGPGVNSGEADDVVGLKPFVEVFRRAIVGRLCDRFLHDAPHDTG